MRDDVSNIVSGFHLYPSAMVLALSDGVLRRVPPTQKPGLSHPIHQVVDMNHVARGKNARHAGLHSLIDKWSTGDGIKCNARLARKFILRDEAYREQQRIAGNSLLGARYRLALFIDLNRFYRFYPVVADNALDRMLQLEWNIVVQKALHIVARQAGQEGHDFQHSFYLGTFKGKPACHDHADVARAQNHEALARHEAFDINKALGRSRSIHARRSCSRQSNLCPRSFTAAHSQHQSPRVQFDKTGRLTRHIHMPFAGHIECHRIQQRINVKLCKLIDKTLRIGRTCQVLLECLEAKSIMNTLLQNPTQLLCPLDDEHILRTRLLGFYCCSQTGGAGTYDNNVVLFLQHYSTSLSLVGRTRNSDPLPFLVISSGETPSSRARISTTRGVSKPP